MPILSIEGGQETTDKRRGLGVYERLQTSMQRMTDAGILFGASVTVTTENMQEVLSDAFVNEMLSVYSACFVIFQSSSIDNDVLIYQKEILFFTYKKRYNKRKHTGERMTEKKPS